MDAILYLLEKYDFDDPALAPGLFQDTDLQVLYDELVAKGEKSLVDASEVGVLIEETDIGNPGQDGCQNHRNKSNPLSSA